MKLYSFITAAAFSLFLSSCADSCSGNSKEEEQLFAKIKKGMSKEEVIKILGAPDTISYSIVDSSEYVYYYFSKNKSGMRSTMPSVIFDSTNSVTFATYGD